MLNISSEPRPSVVIETVAVETLSKITNADTQKGRLEIPESAQPVKIDKRYVFALGLVHLLALLAVIPYFYSLTGVLVGVAGIFVFAMMGINIGYHRLLTHRGFTCPKWLEHTLAILGICTLQDSPARWVAIHRLHHKGSDEQPDPHSPLVSFYWGHIGWLFVRNRQFHKVKHFECYVRDLLRDPFYLKLERNSLWLTVYFLHALLFLAAGYAIGWFSTGTLEGAIQMGFSLLIWGVFVRTIFVLHSTWGVNSISHLWGYRNYKTTDNSRNNWLINLIAHGDGWHNNHHAEQMSASHGHLWYEFDLAWWVIRGFESVGLAKKVVRPRCWKVSQEQNHISNLEADSMV